MTTIVANLECMAADQRMTDCGPIAHVAKIKRIGDSLYGLCGEVSPGLVFLKWFESGKRDLPRLYKMIPEETRYNFTFLELGPQGLALWDGWGVRIPLLDKVYAIGTGANAAVAAVEEHNKSPEEAVRIAMRRDEYSGLFKEPQVEWLIPSELRPKRRA